MINAYTTIGVSQHLTADQTYKQKLDNKINLVKGQLAPFEKTIDKSFQITKIAIPVIALVVLTGIFVILTAHQLLFKGSALSRLNPWSYVIGYGIEAICLGAIAALIVKIIISYKEYSTQKAIQKMWIDTEVKPLVTEAIQRALADDQVLAIGTHRETFLYTREEKHTFAGDVNDENDWQTNISNDARFEELKQKTFITIADLPAPWNPSTRNVTIKSVTDQELNKVFS